MIYLLHGQDEYRIKERLKEIDRKDINSDLASFSFYADQTPVSKIVGELSAISIFSDNKLVSINGLSKNRSKSDQETFSKALTEKSNSPITIILWENSLLKADNWLLRLVQKLGQIETFPYLRPNEVRDWTNREVQSRGGVIDLQATDLLFSRLGRDLNLISNEIDKLLLFDKKVTKSNVVELVGDDSLESIFALMDAISDRDKAKALSLIDSFLKETGDEFILLRMIHRQIKNLLIAKELSSQGKNANQISRELKTPAFVIPKLMTQTKNFTYLQLVTLYEKILNIEVVLKSTTANSNLLFSKFIYDATD